MLHAIARKSFKKDVELAKRRGKNLNKLKGIMQSLIEEKPLPHKNRDHSLIGNYIGRRECHIEPDWLLIYKKEPSSIIFERTGTHSGLFRK